ncbi:hypothetical protein [Hydrogenophaga sp.]|uniref:TubC N-terminal docking domain-related protein n=1 Tax=Hydrogenophaga sp. TaxID=1904254 RepID=UPI003F6F8697
MEAAAIFQRLYAAGVRLELQGERLSASPAARLNEELRALIRTHKPALVTYLIDAHQTTLELIEAAMRACDHHGDGPVAREAMRRECLETPRELRADLRDHLNQTYRGGTP